MDIAELLIALETLPAWAWIVGVLVVLFIASDRTLWDYEAKFPFREGVGRGEVELEGKKKKGPRIECVFELALPYRNKPIDIYLNGTPLFQIAAEKNNADHIRVRESISHSKPNEGEIVTVHIDGNEIFSGALVVD